MIIIRNDSNKIYLVEIWIYFNLSKNKIKIKIKLKQKAKLKFIFKNIQFNFFLKKIYLFIFI